MIAVGLSLAAMTTACGIPPRGVVRTVAWAVDDTGLALLPPPGGLAAARLSSIDAYARCLPGQASCGSGPPTAIELALAIDPGTNLIPPAGTLVWAIEWLDIVCPPSSGGPAVEAPSPPIATVSAGTRCDEIAVVDAATGTFLFTQTAGHDAARP
jgi:hypothetical protein